MFLYFFGQGAFAVLLAMFGRMEVNRDWTSREINSSVFSRRGVLWLIWWVSLDNIVIIGISKWST